jgi:hypothetical protein
VDTIAADGQLLRRAVASYFRTSRSPSPDQPSQDASYVIEHGGRLYVVLQNRSGILAVFRVRTDGVLKGLRRWPHEIEPR